MKPEVIHPLTPGQTWWLLATGCAAFLPLAPRAPLWLIGLSTLAFVWRTALARWHRPLPNRWVLVFITLAGTAGVLIEYRTLFGQRAGVALLLIFLALKQLEAFAARDGLAIVLLAYFLALAQFFDHQTIPAALTTTATVVVTTAALASLTDAQARPAGLLRLGGKMLAQALPFMLILFVLFPRVSGPLWRLPTDAHTALTGLSDNMSPGTIDQLTQSDAIAFRARFDGPPPDRRTLYWRGPVLTRLEGRTWLPGIRVGGNRPFYQAFEGTARHPYEITLEPHNRPWLFALDFPVTLPPNAIATSDFQLLAHKPVMERTRYPLVSQEEVHFYPEDLNVLSEALTLPDHLNPRTVELGARWAAAGGTDLQQLQRASDFLRAQQLGYTLQPPRMSEHVADEFLFDYRRGFCEHFSAAFVVLMRAAGVPARVVTGYQGGERNPVDGIWVIRQSDAHAWTEVWIENRGWLRVDPTALSVPVRIEQNLAAAIPAGEALPWMSRPGFDWLREIRYRWWAVSNAWNQWVLGYDPQRQRDLLTRLGMQAPDWRKMTIALAVLCGLTLLALIGHLLYRRPRPDPVQRQWHKFSCRLARHGLAPHPWEGPQAYARRAGSALPEHASRINTIARLYTCLRYGRTTAASPTFPATLDTLRRHVAAFRP